MFNITQVQNHLTGMGHGGTLKKVRNINELFERAASQMLLKLHPLESMRTAALVSAVYDDFYNYALPSDFGSLIDLIPEDNRQSWDSALRTNSGIFDLQKAIRSKVVSIEGNEGLKMIRIDWRSRQGKVLNTMNSLTSNGAWVAVGSATGLRANSIFKISGSASIEFDLVATGDGIKNTTMNAVDMTDESQVANVFIWVYLPSVPTSISAKWGNDLVTNYWTGVDQTTQADGTALRVGWNLIAFPWATATQAGAVNPALIDSFQLTVNNSVAMNNIRIDNIVFSIGRNFDIKYYSKFLYKDPAVGTWISIPVDGSTLVMIDNDTLPMFLAECLTNMAQQMEGTDSAFDIGFAKEQLATLYPAYRAIYPSQLKKNVSRYGNNPARGRW